MPAKSRKLSTETDTREELPDAWERFERAVDDAVKHGPAHPVLAKIPQERESKTTKSRS